MELDIPLPTGPAAAYRELSDAIERAEELGRVIGATLDDAEKELEDIRRASTSRWPRSPEHPADREI